MKDKLLKTGGSRGNETKEIFYVFRHFGLSIGERGRKQTKKKKNVDLND